MIRIFVGVKTCESLQVKMKWKPLDDIPEESSTTEATVEDCRKRCEKTAGCYGISFITGGTCNLRDKEAELVPKDKNNDDGIETYKCSGIRYFPYLCITLLVKSTFNPLAFFRGCQTRTKMVLYRQVVIIFKGSIGTSFINKEPNVSKL